MLTVLGVQEFELFNLTNADTCSISICNGYA